MRSNSAMNNNPIEFVDPVCGMTVDAMTGFSETRDGKTIHFCSQHCLKKFRSSPREKADCCHSVAISDPHQPTMNHGQSPNAKYFCPMCEKIESTEQTDCPRCGMSLESTGIATPTTTTIYTCPMHPEIEQGTPGPCPICGMDLEPKFVTVETSEDDSELNSMLRRFWVAVALSVPVFSLAMLPMLGVDAEGWFGGPHVSRWIQFALATPVVLWCGGPFFLRGWRSILTWNLNMFTLISLGVGAAYIYSTIALLVPDWIPESFSDMGHVAVYFEAAAVIITLVLLGQVLELSARRRTGGRNSRVDVAGPADGSRHSRRPRNRSSAVRSATK